MPDKKLQCVHSEKCTLPCTHKAPHEKICHGKYAHHNCRDEKSIMCGHDSNGNTLDGNCKEVVSEEKKKRPNGCWNCAYLSTSHPYCREIRHVAALLANDLTIDSPLCSNSGYDRWKSKEEDKEVKVGI
jgi:hypothetical protein